MNVALWLPTITLATCIGLGAGFLKLSSRLDALEARPNPAPAHSTPPYPPDPTPRLDRLEAALKDLESRPAPTPPPAPPSATAVSPSPTDMTLKALEDPAVQARLKRIMNPGPVDQLTSLVSDMGLPPDRETQVTRLLARSHEEFLHLWDQVQRKTWTRPQAAEELTRQRAQMDAELGGLLTPDQFKVLQDRLRPMRTTTAHALATEGGNLGSAAFGQGRVR